MRGWQTRKHKAAGDSGLIFLDALLWPLASHSPTVRQAACTTSVGPGRGSLLLFVAWGSPGIATSKLPIARAKEVLDSWYQADYCFFGSRSTNSTLDAPNSLIDPREARKTYAYVPPLLRMRWYPDYTALRLR
ncbi:hypothetical protein EV702DRAFT_1041583 [Suillus placidus]|uniref:Uncharacterized protein n=1 Tax=Suillus placidus TaxID=48579 RepID=A0A9P7A4V7_9AGAM|nr:hypothetical protein EV702DRAFT_1041583 [Suillus placidus]